MTAPDPIPLRAPDGTIYCWACPTCHHISAGSCMLTEHGPEEIASLSESFRQQAAACCRCQKCGGVAPSYAPDREIFDVARGFCAACWEGGARAEYEARSAEVNARLAEHQAAREKSVERSPDTLAALALECLMGELSQEHCCASWLCDLEYTLWGFVTTEPMVPQEFGVGEVSVDELQALRDLSGKAGGWWRYNEFVPMDEWVAHYREHAAEHPGPD